MIRINRYSLALAGWSVIGACFAIAPCAALAECSQWDLNGEWRFYQSNMEFQHAPFFKLRQTGKEIQGEASYTYYEDSDKWCIIGCGKTHTVSGSVDGVINGNSLELTAYWHSEGSIGVYTGKINSLGRIEGSAYDRWHPETTADWYSDRNAKCLTGASPTGERIGTTSSALTQAPGPAPVKPTARIKLDPSLTPTGPGRSICELAAQARARNSPAAPGLEASCAAEAAVKPVARVKLPPGTTSGPVRSICEMAQQARARNSPAAPGLAAKCAEQGSLHVADLAAKGEAIAMQDPLAVELRQQQPDDSAQRGFDIGMAAAEGQTLPGPGKQKIHDSLATNEQAGFAAAVAFSLERNNNADLARRGAAVAAADPAVAEMRNRTTDVFYRLGFDIATGYFGNPALGADGKTAKGPGSLGRRERLSEAGKRGFDAAADFLLKPNYGH